MLDRSCKMDHVHGFKTLLGVKCHDYPQIPHIYKYNNLNYKQLYGKEISYSNLLDPILHDNNLDNNTNPK